MSCKCKSRPRKLIEIARTLNPHIAIVVRSHSADEAELLRREHEVEVLVGELELASSMVRRVRTRTGAQQASHA